MKYVAYYRVSTKKQERSGLGIESQKAIVAHYAKLDKAKIVKSYTEAASGKTIDGRPKLKAAVEYCNANDCTLVVAKLDRLSRDVEHVFRLKRQLNDKLKCLDLPNTDSLTLSIYAGLAQRERELISIRTKAALKVKKASGAKLGKPENLSDYSRQQAKKAIKAKAAARLNKTVMKYVAILRDEREMSFTEIAKTLNTDSEASPNGKKFYPMTVRRLYLKAAEAQA